MLRSAILRATLANPSRRLLPQSTSPIVLARRCVATAPSSAPPDLPPKLAASAEPATTPTATPTNPTSPRAPPASQQLGPPQAPTADADAPAPSQPDADASSPSQPDADASSPSNRSQSQSPPPSSPPSSHKEQAAKKNKKPRQSSPTPTLPFHVSRTPSHQLAVYQLAKAGDSKKLTVIKKVEGDRAAFKATLAQGLGVGADAVRVNSLTGHVVVAGHCRTEVVGWLEKQGF